MQFPTAFWSSGGQSVGSVVYCPQDITLFRQTPITQTSGSVVYCPQDINQFDRP